MCRFQVRSGVGPVVAQPVRTLDGGRLAVCADPLGATFAVWEAAVDGPLVAMPRTDEINDAMLFRRYGQPPSVYFELFRRSFDQLVAEAEEQVVGVCAYRTDWFQCTFISLVAVREKFRRRGIAAELIRSVELFSPTPRIFSSVEETNGPAIRLHGALGFAPSGHIDNLPQGARELLFYRRVPPRRI